MIFQLQVSFRYFSCEVTFRTVMLVKHSCVCLVFSSDISSVSKPFKILNAVTQELTLFLSFRATHVCQRILRSLEGIHEHITQK